MTTRRKRLTLILALFLFGGFLGWFGTVCLPPSWKVDAGKKAVSKQKKTAAISGGKANRKTDRAGIQAQREAFLKSFEDGEPERVASFWTADGELIGDDGSVFRGRSAIEKASRELFRPKEKRRAEIQTEPLRFPSKDTAVEEDCLKMHVGNAEPTTSRHSVLHVREGGKWFMAVVREWPAETISLRDLEWLIGTWSAKSDVAEVHTSYEWMGDKSFIRVQFSIRQKGRTIHGFQMIGKDEASGELRSWAFESEGGFGEATWSRDGKKWVLVAAGRLSNGSILTATNVLIPLDEDSFTWQAVKRSIGGEKVEGLPPVKVTRVKQKSKSLVPWALLPDEGTRTRRTIMRQIGMWAALAALVGFGLTSSVLAFVRGGGARGGVAVACGREGGDAAGGYRSAAVVGPYGGNAVGTRSGGTVVGPAGGSAGYRAGSGTVTTPRGGTIEYGGPHGGATGRYVGGVQVTAPDGRTASKVGTGGLP